MLTAISKIRHRMEFCYHNRASYLESPFACLRGVGAPCGGLFSAFSNFLPQLCSLSFIIISLQAGSLPLSVTQSLTHPGIPPASSLLAMVTSLDQTSNCHFRSPSTPHSTDPECTPIRIASSTCENVNYIIIHASHIKLQTHFGCMCFMA